MVRGPIRPARPWRIKKTSRAPSKNPEEVGGESSTMSAKSPRGLSEADWTRKCQTILPL